MKYFASIFLLVCYVSACQNHLDRVSNTGIVKLENIKKGMDTIKYNCDNCEKYLTGEAVFDNILRAAVMDAKKKFDSFVSFKPSSIELSIYQNDSFYNYQTGKRFGRCVSANVKYIGIGKTKNGLSIENSSYTYLNLINDKITDIVQIIRLPFLKLYEDGVDRNLELVGVNNEIKISPYHTEGIYKNGVITSLKSKGCMSTEKLTLTLENNEVINLYNYKPPNCDGLCWFPLNDYNLKTLKTYRLKSIEQMGSKDIWVNVPTNQDDYLMQFSKLVSY